jgi:LPXTG-motif cell wall-anchored protein
MKKIMAAFAALVVAGFVLVGFASSASATGNHDHPEVSGKPVTVCHATGSRTNPYVKLTNVPLVQFIGPNGHANHEGDIWAPFSYIERTGNDEGDFKTVQVAGQGDQSLLAFEDCKRPREDTPVVRPEAVYNDECGTKNDTFSVAPGEGYTVSGIVTEGNNLVITATLLDGFKWSTGGDATNPIRFVRQGFTNEPCGLPDTGGEATYATGGGIAALGAALVGGLLLLRRRQTV